MAARLPADRQTVVAAAVVALLLAGAIVFVAGTLDRQEDVVGQTV